MTTTRNAPSHARRAMAFAGTAMLCLLGLPLGIAHAVAAPPSISAPATLNATYGGETHIADIDVTPNDSTSLAVSMAVDHGDLTLASTTGLTFSEGDGTQDATIAFNGANANVASALADVTYRPGEYAGGATLDVQVVDGGSLYYPTTGHFYQFVTDAAIPWADADTDASALTLYGLQGYLATVTSSGENAFIASKLAGQGWMGASDAAAEGEWRWVTGPEGEENAGAGRVFYRDNLGCGGVVTGFSAGAVDGQYNNWDAAEPNDWCPSEEYAHFKNNATWNDYPASLGSIAGYVVEYGGMPGDASTVSTDSTAITVAAAVPGAPTLTSATPGDSQVTVVWSAPASNGGSAITGYTVRATPGGHTTTAAGGATSKTMTGLDNGTEYTFNVKATNSAGNSAWSGGLAATPVGPPPTTTTTTTTSPPVATAPGAPEITSVTPGNQQLAVVWDAPDDGGSTITGYTVSAEPAAGAASASLRPAFGTEVDGDTTTATVDGLTNGTEYSVTVTATNSEGTSEPSDAVSGTPLGRSVSLPPGSPDPGGGGAPETDEPDGVELISVTPTPDGGGAWGVSADGGVFAFGDAEFYGSLADETLDAPVVGLVPTPSGGGYLLFGADGGVFAFGDADFRGSMAGRDLTAPVTGGASTCSGRGYYLASADGGVFAFGDAVYLGSMVGTALDGAVSGIVPTCSGAGYWLYALDGGVFAFGDAGFYGSLGAEGVVDVVGFVPTDSDRGYWLIRRDTTDVPFGDAT